MRMRQNNHSMAATFGQELNSQKSLINSLQRNRSNESDDKAAQGNNSKFLQIPVDEKYASQMSKELALPSHLKKLSFDNILTDIDEDEENENVTKNGSLLNIS